jgi:hypothetical protein
MKEKIRYMVIAIVTCFLILPTNSAFAYLDPASGSMIIQALIAGIAAVSVSIGVFWRRIRSFFRGKKKEEEKSDAE